MAKHILLVEDNLSLQKAIKIKLESGGFAVAIALNGEEALQSISNKNFDLIITDMVMPVKNGPEFLRALKKINIKIPIIVLSNVSRVEERKVTKELGVVVYFVKVETKLEELLGVVRDLIA